MSYIVKTVGDSVTLGILLTKDGVPLPGLAPTLEVRRNSDQLYFDFSAVTPPYWIPSGGQRLLDLPEVAWLPGYYSWVFDQAAYDTGKNDYTAIYRNGSPYTVTDIEVISFTDEQILDISFIRKMLANKQTLQQLTTTHMKHVVFDDDETTSIYEADIMLNTLTATETRDPL